MNTNPFEQIFNKLDEIEQLIKGKPQNQVTQKEKKPIRGINGLAKFLECSPVTAQKLKNSGIIPYSQYDRIIMFDPEKVLAALEKRNAKK